MNRRTEQEAHCRYSLGWAGRSAMMHSNTAPNAKLCGCELFVPPAADPAAKQSLHMVWSKDSKLTPPPANQILQIAGI